MTARTATVLLAVVAFAACQDNENAIARGDRLWADSAYTSALAEYRLAADQRGDPEALLRLAHTLARTGNLDEATTTYDRLLGESDSYRDQAVYDLVALADQGLARNDAFSAAAAMDEALALRPELAPRNEAREVATFFRDRDQPDKALRYFRRALAAASPDTAASLLYQIGLLEEERGRCGTAIDYFRAFREQAGSERRYRSLVSEARWHTGNCAFELAMVARDSGDVSGALDDLERMIELGVPENRLDRAWFERGELLLQQGMLDEALAAYRRVLERNPDRSGRLVERAQERIDQIRFGTLPVIPDILPGDTAGFSPVGGAPAPVRPTVRRPEPPEPHRD
jgi:tetratricopeptide (TPR) repeat protein